MKLLHVTPSFYPATYWGGPIFSVKAITDGVAPHVDLTVLTADAAGPAIQDRLTPLQISQVAPENHVITYKRRIFGASISPGLALALPAAIWRADVVHLTGTYSFPTLPTMTLCKLLGTPLVWSPRGALQATDEWANAPRKRSKQMFEHAIRLLRPKRTTIHVTAPIEEEISQRRIPGCASALIPNSVAIPTPRQATFRPYGTLRLMFLSRLHVKKGIEDLLDAVHGLPDHVTLTLYGDGDPDYVDALKTRIVEMDLMQRVTFGGHVTGEAKRAAFENSDLFVLPTFSENFGIVVAEALAHGLPVITTTAAPWEEIANIGAGLWVEPGAQNIQDAIQKLAEQDLSAIGKRGRKLVETQYSPEAMVKSFLDLYKGLISEGRT